MKAVWNIEKATNVLKDYIAENEIDCVFFNLISSSP